MALACDISEECQNCVWRTSSAANEESTHRAQIQRTLGRRVDHYFPSPRRTHYRYRIQLQPNDKGQLGYHQPRSHSHTPIATCTIAHERINAGLHTLGPAPKGLQRVEFRTNGTELQLHAQSKRQDRGFKDKLIKWADGSCESLALNGQVLSGLKRLPMTLGGVTHQLRPQSFYQVNLPLNEKLISEVVRHVQDANPTHVLDLFSGVGNFAFPIAKLDLPVTAIESADSSFFDARDSQKRTGLSVTLKHQDLRKYEAGSVFADVVILDPPRAGAAGLLPKLLLTRPKRIIYVACHAPSLARDMRALEGKYKLNALSLFEFFPWTPHVETLAVFDRI